MEEQGNQMLITGPSFFKLLSLLRYLKRRNPKASVVYLDPTTLAIHYRKEI
jgi:hypothetical protein